MKPLKITLFLVTVIFLLLVFFPLYILFKIALSQPAEIFQAHPSYFIKQFTLTHFQQLFASGPSFWLPLKKSILVGLCTSMLSLCIGVPAAYAISQFDLRVRYLFILALFISRMLPEVSIALPISIGLIKWGMFDTSIGLILAHLIKVLPVCCFILISVFGQFPVELVQQAKIDGCSSCKAFTKIVLPLSLTGITVAGLFSFLLSWDEFIYASYLTLAEPTMPLKMYYYVVRGNIFYSSTYAIVIMIPVLFLTLIMQRHMKSQYLAGALQG